MAQVQHNDDQNEPTGLLTAGIPDEFKGLRACLRCALIKTYTQVSFTHEYMTAYITFHCFVGMLDLYVCASLS